MNVRKDIFRAGTYRDQNGIEWTFTDQDVRDAFANAKAMLNNGGEAWTPPVIWEHDFASVPMPISAMLSIYTTDRNRRGDTAKNTFGHLLEVDLVKEAGHPVLYGTHFVPDPKDAQQWRNVKWCSPRIDWNVTDPLGRKYPGASVIHIAATTRPIQIDQKPVMLSAWGGGNRSMFLSRIAPMADEKETKKPKEDSVGGANEEIGRLKKALSALGFPIPETASDMDGVCIALEAHALAQKSEPELPADDDFDDDSNLDSPGATASVSPAMLSGLNADQTKVVTTGAAALGVATANARNNLLGRLGRIEKRAAVNGLATPVELKTLRQRLTTVNLSFLDDGNVKSNTAIHELGLLEKSVNRLGKSGAGAEKPKGNTGSGLNLSAFGDPKTGEKPVENLSPEEFDKALQAAAKAAGERVCPTDAK